MSNSSARAYNCKDEELIPICKFVGFSLKRDLAEFTAYSPLFNNAYVSNYEAMIAQASDIVEPESETILMKQATARITNNMNQVNDTMNKVSGYLSLAKKDINQTDAQFGITALRKAIKSQDAEGVCGNLNIVISNIQVFKAVLLAVGLTEDMISTLKSISSQIADDKQQQYQTFVNRKSVVQNNLSTLNTLYATMSEITNIGKILYKSTDKTKLAEYTFTELLKRVRQVSKADTKTSNTTSDTTADAATK
ncbi:MAG: hypothetical protein RIS29_1139 [Bacteroidota bacterium]|jgi:hypothetical protein